MAEWRHCMEVCMITGKGYRNTWLFRKISLIYMYMGRWVLLIWIIVWQGPTALAVGAGGDCLDIFLSSIISLFFLPVSGRRPDIDWITVSKGRQAPKKPWHGLNDVILMFATYWHQCDVITFHRCRFDVFSTQFNCLVAEPSRGKKLNIKHVLK